MGRRCSTVGDSQGRSGPYNHLENGVERRLPNLVLAQDLATKVPQPSFEKLGYLTRNMGPVVIDLAGSSMGTGGAWRQRG